MKVTRSYGCSRVINAPLEFVYAWCTDFRNDDPNMTGNKNTRRILEKTKDRVVYAVDYTDENSKGHVSVVTLKPPNGWHLDTAGNEQDIEVADYKLTKLERNKTRLDIVFKETYVGVKAPSAAALTAHVGELWDKYIVHLMQDYGK